MIPSDYFPLVYNPLDYYNQTDSLTLEFVDSRYNRRYGLNYCSDIYVSGSIYVGGSALTLDGLAYVSGITAGIVVVRSENWVKPRFHHSHLGVLFAL